MIGRRRFDAAIKCLRRGDHYLLVMWDMRPASNWLGAPNRNLVIGWSLGAGDVEVWVEDDGPGLSSTANLFVPFFTTKPQGSGIGLVLSRQIAEAHGGSLALENRRPAPGCRARLRLPLPSGGE